MDIGTDGAEIARVLRQLRLAVFRGDVVVDAARVASWPPGARLALDQCARRAAARGHRFEVQRAAWGVSAETPARCPRQDSNLRPAV